MFAGIFSVIGTDGATNGTAMADRLSLLKVAVRLAPGEPELARQRHDRFRHANPPRQQAVRGVQSLGLLGSGRPHVTYAYYLL